MTPAEDLVLAVAAVLGALVFAERTTGTLTLRAAVLLSAFAVLAVVAALVHMLAR